MNAVLGTLAPSASKIISGVHAPVVGTMEALADQGEIADGGIVAKDGDGLVIPHEHVAAVDMTGTINGTNKAFSATLAPHPVLPGSVQVDNNNTSAQVLVDDGHGRLVGNGEGTVNYKTGGVSVTFTDAPASGKTVKVLHRTRPIGVLVNGIDTAEEDVAQVLVHGAVNRDQLLVGETAADAQDVEALGDIGIYAI